MIEYSKWGNICSKKAKGYSKRSKIFTEIIKELSILAHDVGNMSTSKPVNFLLKQEGMIRILHVGLDEENLV